MTLQCDQYPDCQSQGCTADPKDCKRVRDLRGGVEKHLDLMPRHTAAEFKVLLKGLTDDELFARWSVEYDAQRKEQVEFCIAEMNTRKLNPEVIAL